MEPPTKEEIDRAVADIPLYDHRSTKTSVDGLPLVYEPSVIKKYWDQRPAEMQRRWALFLSVTAPFITRLVKDFTQGTIMRVSVMYVYRYMLRRRRSLNQRGGLRLCRQDPAAAAVYLFLSSSINVLLLLYIHTCTE